MAVIKFPPQYHVVRTFYLLAFEKFRDMKIYIYRIAVDNENRCAFHRIWSSTHNNHEKEKNYYPVTELVEGANGFYVYDGTRFEIISGVPIALFDNEKDAIAALGLNSYERWDKKFLQTTDQNLRLLRQSISIVKPADKGLKYRI